MTTLARRLNLFDAVAIGLGSMLGAGVFVVWGPAADEVESAAALYLALALAALVAACNATSSARLAARYPESGGTYVYGRERLGPFAGFVAGWSFVIGKTASCAAMALTIGVYLWPEHARPIAVAAVVLLTAVNLFGITKTAAMTKVLVLVTLVVLALVVFAGFFPQPAHAYLELFVDTGAAEPAPGGALTAAGLLFFAFAGYARIATLGEEVVEPERTIPRAIPIALGAVLGIYVVIAWTCVKVLGVEGMASSLDPLAEVASRAQWEELAIVVRIGTAIAVCGVLLSLIAGIGRTTLAMGRRADLPSKLASVHPKWRTPWLAELTVAAVVIAVVSLADVRHAIGFSSVTVLMYYAITNLSALTLNGGWIAKIVAAVGLVGCVLLAVSLPVATALTGAAVLALGALAYAWRHRPASPSGSG
ncbi:putative transporter [Rhizocola hellebori]|uniref:Putative transporter n=1 Tax=Rhizocola hellebori TaxID=1392758 RepID=A0A8J3QK02_9ACTN|nr:APC family permease [Rhizocola hellebori]GIH11477.1 putative transporter [Rhizocola hellebori]